MNPRAEKLLSRMRCEGTYVHPHPVAGTRCVSSAAYRVDLGFFCTRHAKEEALRILLTEEILDGNQEESSQED